MNRAVYAGTFDPFTKGHYDIVKRASTMFDEVIILIANNHKKIPTFNRNERRKLIMRSVKNLSNVKVEIALHALLLDDMSSLKAYTIIKGFRNASDLEYEYIQECVNSNIDNNVHTIYLRSFPEFAHISSSTVKEVMELGVDVDWMLDPHTEEAYKEKIL